MEYGFMILSKVKQYKELLFISPKKTEKIILFGTNAKVRKLFKILFCFVLIGKKNRKKNFSEFQTERAFNRDYSRPGKKEI
jgi:hypothetical protein